MRHGAFSPHPFGSLIRPGWVTPVPPEIRRLSRAMSERSLPKIGLAALLAVGTMAWLFLGLRGSNELVFRATRGMWSDDIAAMTQHDVAIVPGVMFRNGKPNSFQRERLQLALQLYRDRRVSGILVSGDEIHAGREASGMKQWLVDQGVPADRITADPLGTRTLVTMKRAAEVFGVRSAIICTQGVYAPRTAFLASAAGINAAILVPKTAVRRASSFNSEHFKITLAFVEHYVLRRVGSPSASARDSAVASTISSGGRRSAPSPALRTVTKQPSIEIHHVAVR